MTYPAVLFWLLLVWALCSKGPRLLYLLAVMGCVGTLAVLPPALTAGVSVVPHSICEVALLARAMFNRTAVAWMLAAALDPRRLGLLAMFAVVAVVATVFFPHLFAGTPVIALRATGQATLPVPLAPTSSNVTQLAYLMLSVSTVFLFAYFAQNQRFLKLFFNLLLISGVAFIGTGLADMLTQAAGLQVLLKPFRNATYVLLVNDSYLGAKRVVGLQPEASAYGPGCVSIAMTLALLRPYFPTARKRMWCAVTTLGLLVMAYLSTSSTAFLGLALFGLTYVAEWARRLLNPAAFGRKTLGLEVGVAGMVVFALLFIIAFDARLLQASFTLIKHFTIEKGNSTSYFERNTWSRTAWLALLDTDGAGIGVGGARTSNWLIALFSNTGFLGGGLLMLFLLQTLTRRPPPDRYLAGVVTALKLGMFVPLATSILAGSSPDFGIGQAMNWGMITGLCLLRVPKRGRVMQTPWQGNVARPTP